MSGINKFIKTLFSVAGIMGLLITFSASAEVEKQVKVRIAQSQEKALAPRDTATANQSLLHSERTAQYKDQSEPADQQQKLLAQKSSSNSKSLPQFRDKALATQLKSSGFYLSSAYVTLNIDQDYDGYYSEFSVIFDADTDYAEATVYAALYLSYEGGAWEHYYSTDNFVLEGWSYDDEYEVTTLLTDGFPPGRYDVLIDLYDTYDDSLVATISADDTYELADLYLEDISYEASGIYQEFSIFDANITLLDDYDNDGFYRSFAIEFDADVDTGDALVFAEIWVRDSSGQWQLEYTTEDYVIDGYSTLDTYILETVWESGYSRGYYDFSIELYDAYTYELLAVSDDFNYALYDVPLEDADSDRRPSSGGSSVSVGVSGSGSFSILLIILSLALGCHKLARLRQ